jgi:hypothetical protein
MSFLRKHIAIVVVFTSPIFAFAQEDIDKNQIIQQRIEYLAESLGSEDLVLTQITEDLDFYYDHPINLNQGDIEEALSSLNLVNDIQINALQTYIQKYGKLISIYELQAVPYWDLETIHLVLPFVRVDDRFDQLHVSLKEMFKRGNTEILLRYQRVLQKKAGYAKVADSVKAQSSKYYFGSPDHLYARARFRYRTNLSFGITAEKDPGEAFFKTPNKAGFDFYSAHAFYKGGKYLKSVAIGDYRMQIGQGLNLWTGYAFNKTADATNVKKNARGLQAYSSVNENMFLRGAAIEAGVKNFSFFAFGSIKKVDASIQQDTSKFDEDYANSVNIMGLHRTNTEIARKGSLTERIVGAYATYDFKTLHLGLSGVYSSYNKTLLPSAVPYNLYNSIGKGLFNIGIDYAYVIKNVNLFGEIVRANSTGAIAFIQGMLVAINQSATFTALYRNYPKNYQSLYAQGFSESHNTQNENGLYLGVKWDLSKSWYVNTYLDFFTFPWLKYGVDAPSKGHEFLLQPTYRPNKQLEIYARFREQHKEDNSRNPDIGLPPLENVVQRNYRLNLSYKASASITLKSRIEFVTVHRKSNTPEKGLLVFQDIEYQPKSFPLSVSARFSIFNTDSYDSRIYAFESNMLNVFSIPANYYKGSRAYLMIRYSFLRHFDLWVKYSTTIYSNKNAVSSGSEMINGPCKSQFEAELRIQL